MRLYDSIGPNPRVVRMFLAERGIDVPRIPVGLLTGENRQPAYLAKNPAGQLPCLELDDGTVLSEITAICRLEGGKRLVSILSAEAMFSRAEMNDAVQQSRERQPEARTDTMNNSSTAAVDAQRRRRQRR